MLGRPWHGARREELVAVQERRAVCLGMGGRFGIGFRDSSRPHRLQQQRVVILNLTQIYVKGRAR